MKKSKITLFNKIIAIKVWQFKIKPYLCTALNEMPVVTEQTGRKFG